MDKTNPRYIEVREKIAEQLYSHQPYIKNFLTAELEEWEELTKFDRREFYNYANQILSIEGITILDKDQITPNYGWGNVPFPSISTVQHDMLNANFKRVIE